MRSKITAKKGLLYISAIVVFVSVISTVSLPFLSSSVYAKTESEMTLAEKTLSYVTLNALRHCMNQNRFMTAGAQAGRINASDISSGTWFIGDANVAGSYLGSGNVFEDGRKSCNAVLQTGLSLWGYSTGLELFCQFGPNRVDGSSCSSGRDGQFNRGDLSGKSDALYEAVKRKVYGGQTPSLSDGRGGFPGRYLIYKAAFEKGCSPTVNANAPADFAYTVTVIGDDGSRQTITYEGVRTSTSRYTWTTRDTLEEGNNTCGEIVELMNDNAAAYREYRIDNSDESTQVNTEETCAEDSSLAGCTAVSSCNIEGIGWLVCPIMNFLGSITDSVYDVIKALLTVSPSMFNREDAAGEATFTAWSIMRTIANVAFVIAFLVIIYSQLTSVGISNYGVKKLLPRLVLSAILVNVSFFVCALFVDVSNIIGATLKGLLDGVTTNLVSSSNVSVSGFNTGTLWSDLIVLVIAGSVALYFALSFLIPVLITAAAAAVTVLVVLVLRQALILLLVVISPLAFVALLLPNTEGLFKKWRAFFTTMLIMYPAIALIFGASSLAGAIIMQSAGGLDSNGSDVIDVNLLVQIAGAGITLIPLFITPLIMRTAGGLLNRFAGIVNNSDKGLFDRMRNGTKRMKGDQDSRRNMKALSPNNKNPMYGLRRRKARVDARTANLSSEASRANTEYVSNSAVDSERFREQLSGKTLFGEAPKGAIDRARARALDTQAQLQDQEVKQELQDVKRTLGTSGFEQAGEDLIRAIQANDTIKARALQQYLLNSGAPGTQKLNHALKQVSDAKSISKDMYQELGGDALASGIKSKSAAADKYYTSPDKEGASFKSIAGNQSTYSALSAVELASQKNLTSSKVGGPGLIEQGLITADMARKVLSNESAVAALSIDATSQLQAIAQVAGADAAQITINHAAGQTGGASFSTGSNGQTSATQTPSIKSSRESQEETRRAIVDEAKQRRDNPRL